MIHEELFKKTLDSLNIKNIILENYDEEQIFYQLKEECGDDLHSLEQKISTQLKKNDLIENTFENSDCDSENETSFYDESNISQSEASQHDSSETQDSRRSNDNEETSNLDNPNPRENFFNSSESEYEIELNTDESKENYQDLKESDKSNSTSSSVEEKNSEESENFSAESTVSFDPEMWEGESNDSDIQILNLPASEVLKIMKGNDKKKQPRFN